MKLAGKVRRISISPLDERIEGHWRTAYRAWLALPAPIVALAVILWVIRQDHFSLKLKAFVAFSVLIWIPFNWMVVRRLQRPIFVKNVTKRVMLAVAFLTAFGVVATLALGMLAHTDGLPNGGIIFGLVWSGPLWMNVLSALMKSKPLY